MFQSLEDQTAGLESATHTSSGTCNQEIDSLGCFRKKFPNNFDKSERKCHVIWRHLIDSEANSLEVAVKPLLLSSILLHQPQKKGAPVLPVQRVVIHVLQMHQELGVGRECG